MVSINASIDGWMPIATPQRIRSRVPPSSAESGLFARFAKRSHTAISTVAFAMRCSRIHATLRSTSSAEARSALKISGRMNSSSAYRTIRAVSPEYHGTSPATLSPHPTAPSDSTRHKTRVMCVSRARSEEHTSELQSPYDLVCRLLLEKKKKKRHLYKSHRLATSSLLS